MVQFMSPELLVPACFGLGGRYPTKESDCYALGMVIFEVLSGQVPFSQNDHWVVRFHVMHGRRPSRPQGNMGELFTDGIWEILELCWKHQPGDRISAKDVLLHLEQIQSPLQLPPGVGGDVEADISDILPDPGMLFSSVPGSLLIIHVGSTT